MKGWRNVTLSDISMAIDYGYTASSSNINIGPKFLRITDIATSNIIDWNSVPFCSISQEDNEKYKLYPGDIVIARTGASTGATYTIKDTDPKDLVFASYLIRYRINPEIADAKLVGKFLRSKNWNEYVSGVVGGSAQPGANAKVLGAYSFLLPPLTEQRAIAAVLSSLDDKIDLLYRQNATLEAMAEALFRQWFIVEAKEEWEHGFLPDEFEFVMGQSPNGHSFNEIGMGTPMFQGNADFGFRFPSARIYTTEPTRVAQKFDTLISVRAPVGAQNMAQDRCCIGRGLAAFRYKNNSSFYSYAYFKLRYLLKEILVYNDEGTVFGSISKNDFNKIEIIIPDYNSVSEFENMILSINNKVISNCQQINTLEKLRDTLLPKLMSGEVRVDF